MLPDLPGWESLPTVTRYHNWAEIAEIVVLAILVIAEVVSFGYGHRKDDLTERQQTATNQRHDEEMARLHVEAARLSAEAESARAAIAESKAREKEAELKLAQLEKKVTPRVIDDEQAGMLIEKLKLFSGVPFAVESDPAAEYAFVNRVIEVLQRSGWKWLSYLYLLRRSPSDTGTQFRSINSAVQVCINASRLADFRKPAETLAFALTQALQASVGMGVNPPDSPHACSPDAIHVEIQRKL